MHRRLRHRPRPPSFWTQVELSGDWGGARSRLKGKGLDFELTLTQFWQGVASGGVDNSSEYFGTFQTEVKSDLGKTAGWEFWAVEFKTETRFGGPLPGGSGTINPVNTAAIIPAADGTVFSITAVNVTKLFPIDLKKGDLVAVAFGRFNLVDLLDEDFFAGGGTERFFNIAQIGPLTVLRQVPLITNAISTAWLRGGEPFVTFALMDPNDHSTTTGLSNLFADGVTFAPAINLPSRYFGKTGKHTISFAITTKEYTPFDAIRQVVIPGPPLFPVEPERGSWSLGYTFRQYIVERGRRDGWGLFAQASVANESTSPISTFFDIGLGGNGLLESRPLDEFGVAYAYTNLSDELKDNLDLVTDARQRAEHQFEVFYNLHATPWLRLTGDLQIIRPTRPVADTAVVPGVRLGLVF
jgi:porin